jgi:hypothetical protein
MPEYCLYRPLINHIKVKRALRGSRKRGLLFVCDALTARRFGGAEAVHDD